MSAADWARVGVERRVGRSRVRGRPARAAVAVACGFGLALSSAAPASAHATFDQKELPADADRGLTMSVPVEEKDAHNVKVTVRLPEGFDAFSCRPKRSWSCTAEPAGPHGPARVIFTRISDETVVQVDSFRFAVHTPTEEGSYPVPVDQEYSSGKTVRWEGPENSFNPAPIIRIVTEK